jgi:hypothetical protein
LPLAERGFDVIAVEPAEAMLEALRANAAARELTLGTLHASAEKLPFAARSLDAALIADALHFCDAELTGRELGRVLGPLARLFVVSVDFADTPFMRGVVSLMQSAAPRRPRDMAQAIVQLFALGRVPLERQQHFNDETPVDEARLEGILRSISFIGPAMNAARFAAFRERILGLPGPRIWARRFVLYSGAQRR